MSIEKIETFVVGTSQAGVAMSELPEQQGRTSSCS
jgi:hypothetical protein